MRIPDFQTLNHNAEQRLSRAAQAGKIVLIYAGLSTAAAALVTAMQYYLGSEIAQTGGLSNLGLRSVLSSVSEFLPLLQTVFLLLLDFGYMACMVRISRGQYSSPNTLRAGMDRFGVLLRCTLLRVLVYIGAAFAGFYLSMGIFLISPFSQKLLSLLSPMVSESAVLTIDALRVDDATAAALYRATIPALIIFAIVAMALIIPLYYRFRMCNYVIYDNPGQGALYALRESRKMMHRNRISMFRLDLHFWWYYLILVLAGMVAYGNNLLAMAGITLPFSDIVSFFLFYFISLSIQFAAMYFLRNRIETVYALTYDALRPPKQDSGVVLGNIFQM